MLTSALPRTPNLQREHGWERLTVDGVVPPELRGTLYRCGPALFELFGARYGHPFEGDGGVTAVRFAGGHAEGATRVVESAGLLEERAAGRRLYGMSLPWWQRMKNMRRGKQKNTANTHVVPWQGRLFALMEGARPTEIDPDTLATVGETDLDGVVGPAFSAHPHHVVARRTLYNFGLAYGRGTMLDLHALPDDGPARRLGSIPLPGPPMLHDFIATDTHLVVFLSPVRISLRHVFLQLGGLRELITWRPEEGTEIICIPLAGDGIGEPIRFTVEPFFQWHFANAHGDGRTLVVDYVRYPDLGSFHQLGGGPTAQPGTLHRATIDLAARRLVSEPIADGAMEFPRIHPRVAGGVHRHVWATGRAAHGLVGGVVHVDVASGRTRRHELPGWQQGGEPVFVPRDGAVAEDDGWLLQLVADSRERRSFLAVYDAPRLEDGPVARAWFDQLIPMTYHGSFV